MNLREELARSLANDLEEKRPLSDEWKNYVFVADNVIAIVKKKFYEHGVEQTHHAALIREVLE
jgi:hypothetical protein